MWRHLASDLFIFELVSGLNSALRRRSIFGRNVEKQSKIEVDGSEIEVCIKRKRIKIDKKNTLRRSGIEPELARFSQRYPQRTVIPLDQHRFTTNLLENSALLPHWLVGDLHVICNHVRFY